MCVCVTESLCRMLEISTLQINYTALKKIKLRNNPVLKVIQEGCGRIGERTQVWFRGSRQPGDQTLALR